MKQTLILALVAAANAVDLNTYKFMKYISEFNKNPGTVGEFNMRMRNFMETDAFIEEWNADPTNTHRVGHNFISDWSAEEKENSPTLEKAPTSKTQEKTSRFTRSKTKRHHHTGIGPLKESFPMLAIRAPAVTATPGRPSEL